jgi:hypothetical protein|tara:strand:+ start:338 stop:487 length:150 start_codon:yes stop_codon:yes gene_type:complete
LNKKKRKNKKTNPIARWLRLRRYRMLVMKNKKKYNRKKIKNDFSRDRES